MAPEQIVGEAVDIEAGGTVQDGVLTITAQLGETVMTIVTPADGDPNFDTLYASLPQVYQAVFSAILAQIDDNDNEEAQRG
jgi:hypothetical protein